MGTPEWIKRACADALAGASYRDGQCPGCGRTRSKYHRAIIGGRVCETMIAQAQAAADEISNTRAAALLLGGPDGGPGWCNACETLVRLGLESCDGEITPRGRLTREILRVHERAAAGGAS